MEYGSSLVLLPPFAMLFVAFSTRRTYISFFVGLIAAALVAKRFYFIPAMKLLLHRLFIASEIDQWRHFSKNIGQKNPFDHFFIFTFLIMLGIIIVLVNYTGGTMIYAKFMKKLTKDTRTAELSTMVLCLFLVMDDYLSTLTAGNVMRPIFDQFKIPRVKLAYIIDSMAAPVCILSPISSWCATITMELQESGITTNLNQHINIIAQPFNVYLKTIPFIFYSFILIAGLLFIVYTKASFGPMHSHEKIAKTSGNLFGGKNPLVPFDATFTRNKRNTVFSFFFPFIALIISVVLIMLYQGYLEQLKEHATFIQGLKLSNTFYALFLGSLISVFTSILYFLIKKNITLSELPFICWKGFRIMADSILILLLSWALGTILQEDLHLGSYLAHLFLLHNTSLIILPFLLFLTSWIVAFAIGSSWGAIALLTPITIPMLITIQHTPAPLYLSSIPILLPALGAILSGAVAGDHLSPLSDTTLMTVTSTGVYHFDHVETQFWYGLPALISAGISFILVGYLYQYRWIIKVGIPLITGIIFYIILLWSLQFLYKKFLRKKINS